MHAGEAEPKLLVFGAGYTGARVLMHMRHAGFQCAATVRSEASAARVQAELGWTDVEVHFISEEMTAEDRRRVLAGVTHVLSTAPPSEGGDPMVRLFRDELLVCKGTLQWIGYLSATSVYGDHEGAAVDETSELRAKGPRAVARLAAEQDWLNLDLPVRVLRLPGIYGPGRGSLSMARQGNARRIDKPNHTFSRIHVDDIVRAVAQSIRRPWVEGVVNVGDDYPCAGHEPVAEACRLLEIPPPPLIPWAEAEAGMSRMLKSFYADNKMIANKKMHEALGVRLRYPTYKEGLSAALHEELRLARLGLPYDFPARPVWCIMVDHGSSAPASTLALRDVCRHVEREVPGMTVLPASMRFSDAVPPAALEGERAELLPEVLQRLLAGDPKARVCIVPFSVTVSLATGEVVTAAQQRYPDAAIRVGRGVGAADETDSRLAEAFAHLIDGMVDPRPDKVLLVDHGSPREATNAAHARLATQLSTLVAQPVVACSMEAHRPTPTHPLLAAALADSRGVVALAKVFMLPGTHAGPGGDLDRIVADAVNARPALRVVSTPLIGLTPCGVGLLADEARRLQSLAVMQAQL